MKNIARLALIKDDMEAITKRWKAVGGHSAPPQAIDVYNRELKTLFAKNNCNPMAPMIGIFVQVINIPQHLIFTCYLLGLLTNYDLIPRGLFSSASSLHLGTCR